MALAKALMVQGTASSVGKSTLVAALCRILKQQGLNVAPFKAQNMSLNAFVTPDGAEIGRAQAVQAEAAGIEPSVLMNPVLLKPEADNRCQLVVKGKPLGQLAAADFPSVQKLLWAAITESLDLLLARYDAVVIEGAGSPAEVNLKQRDLVNMRVALYSNAPVLLVADIDRGGVFASLVGTLDLLDPAERDTIKAFVINKFRGDRSLLEPGLDWLERRTRIPVAGVIPYYQNIHLPEEDSLSLERRRSMKNQKDYILDIAVIAPPHIANFDDFDPFEREAGVRLRYVEAGDELGAPDLILLPGTKSTAADLVTLRQLKRDQEILERARRGVPIIGICGGYQMMGESISDPDRLESEQDFLPGLALLPVKTRFGPVKATHQIKARVLDGPGLLRNTAGMEIGGYEIHMGETVSSDAGAPFRIVERSRRPSDETDGYLSADGNMLGTYIHGLFHNATFRRALLAELAARKGRMFVPAESPAPDACDQLAALVRANLDLGLIFGLMNFRARSG